MRKSQKILCSSIILILLTGIIQAQEISEADAYYVSAKRYMSTDDYKNALRSVQLARMIYENLSNLDAVRQCDELVDEISSEITPSMKAGYYYAIAEDFFFEGEKNQAIEPYSKSIAFASLAKQVYTELDDKNNVQRAEDIIERAKSVIERYFSNEKMKANHYYNLARTHFIRDEYLIALSYAENASLIYSLIPDSEGVERTQTLVNSINEKINLVKQNAQSVCDTAMNLYNENKIDDAQFYASKCKVLYQSIDYSPGILRANNLRELISDFTQYAIEQKKTTAARLFKEAEEALVRKQYANATEGVRQAREIYVELREQTLQEDKTTRDYYQGFISDCDRLYLKISSEWGSDRKKLQAEQFFSQAQQYYIDQFFDEALTYTARAKHLFEDLEDYVGVSKSSSLIGTINERVSRERMGDGNLSLAKDFLSVADFENAFVNAERARKIYSTLMGSNKTVLAEELLTRINESAKKKEDAAGLYNLAYEQFNAGNYEAAKNSVEQAYNIYVGINYSIGISESKSLLDQASDRVAEAKAKQRTTILSVLIVVVVLAILVVKYMQKKKKMEEAARLAEEERKKREEMEKKKWEVRREVEAERLAEEKFKEIVAEERDLVAEGKETIEKDLKEDLI